MRGGTRTRERGGERPRPGRAGLLSLAVLVGALWAAPASAQQMRYLYDSKGQIVAVIDADGSAATYQWDESGNLAAISRRNAGEITGQVGITLVSPNVGIEGDVVEIFGKGFSATPTNNTVTFFSGVQATVDVANPNYLKVTVPSGAATGLIHIADAGVVDEADSPTQFTVLSAAPLTITPGQVSLLPTRTQSFTASSPALWAVEGIPGGNPQVGTITTGVTTTATYTAPSTGPFPRQVTVGAFTPDRPSNQAEAIVTLLDRKSTRLNSSHSRASRMPSSA